MTLTDFLLARIAEDEGETVGWTAGGMMDGARFNLARVLAECDAETEHRPTEDQMSDDGAMTEQQANDVYDALVEVAGASERNRDSFVYSQTREFIPEWRFMGDLGFGGKFWRNTGFLPDGSWGEKWYVNYYSEHETPARRSVMQATNARLEPICAAACS